VILFYYIIFRLLPSCIIGIAYVRLSHIIKITYLLIHSFTYLLTYLQADYLSRISWRY